ncbi:MAG: hypothetical protein K9W44_01215 [Candidatus Lokiarchaeota archaeon]|nr:hypothetical protein [Candidatus Harpocratesius repetitus]
MTAIITYFFEFLTTISALLSSFFLLKKGFATSESKSSRFLGFSSLFLGIYALSTIIYSFANSELAIIVLLKLGMIMICFSLLFLFYTMKILINSSFWLSTNRSLKYIMLGITSAISLLLGISNYIQVTDIHNAETHFEPIPFYIFASFIGLILIYSIFTTYYLGVKKTKGVDRKKMIFFFIGLICMILGLIMDAIGNFVENETLFDSLLFGFLSVGNLCIVFCVLYRNRKEN